MPTLNESSQILNDEMILQIVRHLPPFVRLKNWQLVYGFERDGMNYNTLIRKNRKVGPNVFVIKDSKDNIFGAYLTHSLHYNQQFYGTGECFIFRTIVIYTNLYLSTYIISID